MSLPPELQGMEQAQPGHPAGRALGVEAGPQDDEDGFGGGCGGPGCFGFFDFFCYGGRGPGFFMAALRDENPTLLSTRTTAAAQRQ